MEVIERDSGMSDGDVWGGVTFVGGSNKPRFSGATWSEPPIEPPLEVQHKYSAPARATQSE
jgi:hypothetical protein